MTTFIKGKLNKLEYKAGLRQIIAKICFSLLTDRPTDQLSHKLDAQSHSYRESLQKKSADYLE